MVLKFSRTHYAQGCFILIFYTQSKYNKKTAMTIFKHQPAVMRRREQVKAHLHWRTSAHGPVDIRQWSGGSPADQVIFPFAHDGPPVDIRRTTSGRPHGCPPV
jgi:hypothetical protein